MGLFGIAAEPCTLMYSKENIGSWWCSNLIQHTYNLLIGP